MDPFILSILGLVGACFIAAILFVFRGPIVLKLAVVGFFFALSIALVYTFEFYKGWPTTDLPDKATVVAIQVVEPVAIYVWMDNIEEKATWYDDFKYQNPESGRLYVMPYSKEDAEAWGKSQEAINRGHTVTFGAAERGSGTVNPNQIGGGEFELEVIAPEELLPK